MGRTYTEKCARQGISYSQFFAKYRSKASDLNSLRDSDDGTPLISKYNSSNPPDGWFRLYWENGNLRYEWKYKNGKQDGVAKAWWPNGDLKNIRNYKNGLLHGPLKGWWENGLQSGVREYKYGKRHGNWTDWYDTGEKWCEKIYNNGNLVSKKYWNRDGSKAKRGVHTRGEARYFRKLRRSFPTDSDC